MTEGLAFAWGYSLDRMLDGRMWDVAFRHRMISLESCMTTHANPDPHERPRFQHEPSYQLGMLYRVSLPPFRPGHKHKYLQGCKVKRLSVNRNGSRALRYARALAVTDLS